MKPQSEFYTLENDNMYTGFTGVQIEHHDNDENYPVSLSVKTLTGVELGIVLTHADLDRLALEANLAE